MRICLATYGERLAAWLENAGELRLFETGDGKAESAGVLPAVRGEPEAMLRALAASGADVLICGAVSGYLRRRLQQDGVRVAPWIGGTVGDVLRAFLEDRLEAYRLPGCGGRRGCGRHRKNCKERS